MKGAAGFGSYSLMAVATVLVAALVGCAAGPQSYVVLLPNDDGTVGKVAVTGKQGTSVLANAREATLIAGAGGPTFVATQEQIARDFGAALAASPKKPLSFNLYFLSAEVKLTPESTADLARVAAEVASRPVPDIAIIGHTDTAGDARQNEKLGLERAKLVAAMLADAKLGASQMTVESHGENNLLVPTADNVAEPRNRRVEVTVR